MVWVKPKATKKPVTLNDYRLFVAVSLGTRDTRAPAGEIKIKESYRNGEFSFGTYFLDSNETLADLIQERILTNKQDWAFCYNKLESDLYKQWICDGFSPSGVLAGREILVMDDHNRMICHSPQDITTGAPIGFPHKYYYSGISDVEYEDRLLSFRYNIDGTLDSIFDNHNTFGFIKPLTLDEFLASSRIQSAFPWAQHSYYHALYPFLPSGNI